MGTVQHVDDGLLHSSGRNLSFLLSILGLVAQRGIALGMDLRAPRDSFPSMECSDARTCRQGCQGERCETVFFCFAPVLLRGNGGLRVGYGENTRCVYSVVDRVLWLVYHF